MTLKASPVGPGPCVDASRRWPGRRRGGAAEVAGWTAAAAAKVPPGSSAVAAIASGGAEGGAAATGASGGRGVAVSVVEGDGLAGCPGGPPVPRSALPPGACLRRRGAEAVFRAEDAATPGPKQGLHLAGGEPKGSRPHLAGEVPKNPVKDFPVSGERRVYRVAVLGLVFLVAPPVIGGGGGDRAADKGGRSAPGRS